MRGSDGESLDPVGDMVADREYELMLGDLKQRIAGARVAAQRSVNTQLIELYWSIGQTILERQDRWGWGSKVITRLAGDLRREFPQMKGFSQSNLQYMRSFAAGWPVGEPISQQPAGKLPWGHIMVLLDKLDDPAAREWYAEKAVEFGWTRSVLLNQIMNKSLERTGAAPSNFATHLAPHDSELAQQIAKDPYVFDFLDLNGEVAERALETALTERVVETLRELGTGFAFVGRQVHFEVDGDDFFVDLLFFHVEQLRYVVVELKTDKFRPEHAGQLGFYVAVVDDQLRRPAHAATVGILICATRKENIVRYALGRSASPMAVSTYTYDSLPPEEKGILPDEAALEAALSVSRVHRSERGDSGSEKAPVRGPR